MQIVTPGPRYARGIAETQMRAMYEDINWRQLWKDDRPLELIIEDCAARTPKNLCAARQVRRHQIMVEDGTVLGYARWVLPEERSNEWLDAQVELPSEDENDHFEKIHAAASVGTVARGLNAEYTTARGAPLDAADARITKDRSFLTLDYLAVHPDHQRQGIAALLVKSGICISKKLKLDLYVMATQAGLRTYQKLGFVVEEVVTQCAGEHGLVHDNAHYFMTRSWKVTI